MARIGSLSEALMCLLGSTSSSLRAWDLRFSVEVMEAIGAVLAGFGAGSGAVARVEGNIGAGAAFFVDVV